MMLLPNGSSPFHFECDVMSIIMNPESLRGPGDLSVGRKTIKRRLSRVKSTIIQYTPTGSKRPSLAEVSAPASAVDIIDPSEVRVASGGVGPTPPVEQREARLSENFQANMLQSMYGPLRSSLSGASNSASNDDHDQELEAHPKMVKKAVTFAGHSHANRHAPKRDVYKFTGDLEFDQTVRKNSDLPEDMCSSFEYLRQLLETSPEAVARAELLRTLVAMEQEYGPGSVDIAGTSIQLTSGRSTLQHWVPGEQENRAEDGRPIKDPHP